MSTQNSDSGEDDNIFDEYSEYSKIESHIEFSKSLYILNKKGKHILSELEQKKYERISKNGKSILGGDIKKFYILLVHILNLKRFSQRLHTLLKHNLDNLLFKEIKKIDIFYIEDEKYCLTKLYYDPSLWIKDYEIQAFSLDICNVFNVTEAMCLICFLREYEELLFEIEEYIRDTEFKTLKSKIDTIIRRIKYKLKTAWDIIMDVIKMNF